MTGGFIDSHNNADIGTSRAGARARGQPSSAIDLSWMAATISAIPARQLRP